MTDKDEDTIFEKYKWTARQINLSMEEADSTDVAKDINEDLKSAMHEATLLAKQEQLAEDIKKFRKLILEEADIGHPDTYEDGRNHYDCLECAQTDMAKRLLEALHALKQSQE